MFDFLAPLFNRKVVYLLDFDGETTKRWAKPTPFGYTCARHGFKIGHCLLLKNGSVKGPPYVIGWLPATESEAAE